MQTTPLTHEDRAIFIGLMIPRTEYDYRDADRKDAAIMMRAQYYQEAHAVAPDNGQFTLAHQVRSKARADRA